MGKLPKKNKRIVLPQIRNYIVQPNRVTKSRFGTNQGGYTLIQHKILTSIMYYLQDPIQLSMKGQQYTQLEMFTNPDLLKLNIPLSEIGRPDQYNEIRESVKQLASVVVAIPYTTKEGREMERITGLIRADLERIRDRSSIMTIEIEKKVADILIKIDRGLDGTPKNYTRHAYEVTKNATCKFTPVIYKLLCSWRKKGEFKISLEELKLDLCIPDMYKEYRDFKRRVLVPVMEELKEIGDCWFDCTKKSFIEKKKGKPTMLHFKVITPDHLQEDVAKADYIRNMLRMHFGFKDSDIEQVNIILHNYEVDTNKVLAKISYLSEVVHQRSSTEERIINKKNFVLTSLLNEFV